MVTADSNIWREAAIAKAELGKLTPEALYVHIEAVRWLPLLLLQEIDQARQITPLTEKANLIKIHRRRRVVSFLSYPDFDNDPHPALMRSVVVDVAAGSFGVREYRESLNPPILHRKETLVSERYRLREEFARLTQAEEEAGLLRDTSTIGTAKRWKRRLVERGYEIRGHELVRPRAGTVEVGRGL